MAGPLHAQVISAAIAPYLTGTGATGRVHSVFRAALNVEFDDELLTFATPSTGALPNGVVLDSAVNLLEIGVLPGSSVWSDGRAVHATNVTVELDGAELWTPRLEPGGPWPALEDMRGPLVRALARRSPPGGFSPLLEHLADASSRATLRTPAAQAYPSISDLVRSVRANDLLGALDGARRLIGLGDGLTPSGDDFLIGCAAALRALDHPLQAAFASGCRDLARDRTTSVAEMFYRFAARGEFSARIHSLIGSLREPAHELTGAFDLALGWGASSGADCLLGLLLGGKGARRPTVAEVP